MRPFPTAWIVGAWVASLLLGCAYVPPDMVPAGTMTAASPSDSPFSEASLMVAMPAGAHPGFWRMVNGDVGVQLPTFQEALIRSLRQSALFAAVSDGKPARYELHAEILRQDEAADGVVLVVRYGLSDSQGGRQLFGQEIETSSSTAEDAAPGASLSGGKSAASRAAFRAAGKNIALLLARLRTLEPR